MLEVHYANGSLRLHIFWPTGSAVNLAVAILWMPVRVHNHYKELAPARLSAGVVNFLQTNAGKKSEQVAEPAHGTEANHVSLLVMQTLDPTGSPSA